MIRVILKTYMYFTHVIITTVVVISTILYQSQITDHDSIFSYFSGALSFTSLPRYQYRHCQLASRTNFHRGWDDQRCSNFNSMKISVKPDESSSLVVLMAQKNKGRSDRKQKAIISQRNPKGFQSSSSKKKNIIKRNDGSMNMALCIVPPDEAWDNIQRARHLARDPTFYKWPPAIRLFHPFLKKRSELVSAASSISEVIEKYDLEPFTITLDQLLILPHWEVLETQVEEQSLLPTQQYEVESSNEIPPESASSQKEARELQAVQDLIEQEEQKGLQKLKRRMAKDPSVKPPIPPKRKRNKKKDLLENELSPQERLQQQQKQQEEYAGPCVICLEPNEESKENIEAFREILRRELYFDYDEFSPSGSLSKTSSLPDHKIKQINKFRPVLPIGSFSSVQKAVDVARKLQKLWEPLSFNVTDLHLVSSYGSASTTERLNKKQDDSDQINGNSQNGISYDENGQPILPENRELMFRQLHGTDDSDNDGEDKLLTTRGDDFGCDAMIMLQGEENSLITPEDNGSDQLQEDEEMIMNILMSDAGIPGGGDREMEEGEVFNERPFSKLLENINNDDDDDQALSEGVAEWLDDDDEWEEGATIVVGRIQFFMGELRQYVG